MEEHRELDLRLAPAALAAWGGALVAGIGPGEARLLAVAAALVALAALLSLGARLRRRSASARGRVPDGGVVPGFIARGHRPATLQTVLTHVAVAGALVTLVGVSAAVQHDSARGPAVAAALESGRPVSVRAVVTGLVPDAALLASGEEAPGWSPGGAPARFEARAIGIGVDGAWAEAGTPLLVFGQLRAVGPERTSPGIGSLLELDAVLKPAEHGLLVLAFARGPAEVRAGPSPLLAWSHDVRERFVERTSALPGRGAELLPGLAVGDTRAVSPELDADMRAASLTHLTAVSGANCAIVVGGVVALGRLLGWRRGVRLAAGGCALAAFVVLVTPEGSVVRAGAMATVVLAVEATGRPVRGLPVLLLAVMLLLAASPALAADAGFALSVAATAGLLLGTRPIADRLAAVVPRPLALTLAVPIAAQLACQPVLLLISDGLPVYGIVANLLAAPAAPIATVVGLAAVALATVAPPIAGGAVWLAWVPAEWIGTVARLGSWPGARLDWPTGLGGALLLAVVTAALCAWLLVRPRRRRTRRIAWIAGVAALVVVAIVAGLAIGHAVLRARTFPSEWRIASCDVGQGDATLVRGEGTIALIDTGPEPAPLAACLDVLGIDRIDLLVLSHFDHDHDGAASSLVGRVGAVAVPDTRESALESIVEVLARGGATVTRLRAGDAWTLGGASWTVLWPPAASDGGPSTLEGNDGSLVVRVDGGACRGPCPSFLALGDLGEAPQLALLRAGADRLRADIVKMSHHGSRDQAPTLYEAVAARAGLVSVGADNGYGHPTAAALSMLAQAGTAALRTDELGTIVLAPRADGELVAWSTGPPDDGHRA